jgi:hypothetical protein
MPALPNPRQERYAQLLAKGTKQIEAYVQAGYSRKTSSASQLASDPRVAARVTELQIEVRRTEEEARQKAVKKLALTEEWIVERLMYNAERCLRGQPILDKNGVQIPGQYTGKPDSMGANKALELLGKYKGMFIDRHEFGAPGAFAAMTDEELSAKIEDMGSKLGIPPKALQAMVSGTKH